MVNVVVKNIVITSNVLHPVQLAAKVPNVLVSTIIVLFANVQRDTLEVHTVTVVLNATAIVIAHLAAQPVFTAFVKALV